MTRFRRNHTAHKSSASVLKFSLYALILLCVVGYSVYKMDFRLHKTSALKTHTLESDQVGYYLPTSTSGMVVHHDEYSLSYVEEHEQAEWIAYELTREKLKLPNVERTGWYNPDDKIRSRSAVHKDYSGSGYTRGHLAPAGDMAHNINAMKQSFYMSNISPQLRAFNNGIWKELEENIRDWAFSFEKLYVITGPILTKGIRKKIGHNQVSIPAYFYKIVLDVTSVSEKMIAFLIPNEKSDDPLSEYIISVDSLEALTGLDFFPNLLNDEVEEQLEAETTAEGWKFSEKRYQLRIKQWNYQ